MIFPGAVKKNSPHIRRHRNCGFDKINPREKGDFPEARSRFHIGAYATGAHVKPMRGFKTLPTASATTKGFEMMRMIRKWQCLMLEPRTTGEVRFVNRLFRLAA